MKCMVDHSDGAYAIQVACSKCKMTLRLADAVMDLRGKPFEAYYHKLCAEDLLDHRETLRCYRNGCTRCPVELYPKGEKDNAIQPQ